MTTEERAVIKLHQEDSPVDVTALATALGLSVYESWDLPDGISGKIVRDLDGGSPAGYSVYVNAAETYRRRRFTIAHECAHYILHRSKIGDELTDNAMYRSDKLNSKDEIDANNLAADLLMPRHLMAKSMKDGFSSVSELAEKFDVSLPAMRVRMRYLYQGKY